MKDQDLPRDAETEDLLAGQAAEVQPPAELHVQVVDALRARGLIRATPGRGPTLAWWSFTAAAAVVAFFAGRMTAAAPGSTADAVGGPSVVAAGAPPPLMIPDGRSAWMFLLYEDGRFDAGDLRPHEVARAYDAWAAAAADQGVLLLGEKFADEETLVTGAEVITRPLSITAPPGMLGGMLVVAAPDRAAAVALARETPHHELGGIVVVRQIDRRPR